MAAHNELLPKGVLHNSTALRFEHFGPNDRYTVVRIDRDHRRFWLPAGYFEVAPSD